MNGSIHLYSQYQYRDPVIPSRWMSLLDCPSKAHAMRSIRESSSACHLRNHGVRYCVGRARDTAEVLEAIFSCPRASRGRLPTVLRLKNHPPARRFYPHQRFVSPQLAPLAVCKGAPDLAVEIVSPSDSAQDLEIKIKQYLQSGARQVWVLHPKPQSIHLFSSISVVPVLDANETLEGGNLFPGFAVKVGDLFAIEPDHAPPSSADNRRI